MEAGSAVGLRHAGLKALASLRMEKGYRDYGHDIDNTDWVLEAGLGFAVDLKKPGGFVGKEAVLAQKAAGPLQRRLLQILVKDPEPLMFHAEIVHRDGRAGRVHAGRVVRPHARRRGGAGDDRRPATRRSIRRGSTPAAGRSTSPAGATRPPRRSARCSIRRTSASSVDAAPRRAAPRLSADGAPKRNGRPRRLGVGRPCRLNQVR